MNREIKYRAFHIKEKRMFEVADIIFYEEIICELVTKNEGMMGLEHEVLVEHDFDAVIIMQFIGMDDKQNEDIYEGDILSHATRKYPMGIVEFYEGSFVARWKGGKSFEVLYQRLCRHFNTIGNEHEHPNLLKGET